MARPTALPSAHRQARLSALQAPRAPWRWAITGALLGLTLSLLLFAPARWLASAVDAASQGHVRLDEPRGTVWNGSAQLVLAGGADSRDAAALPTRLMWQLRPVWLGLDATLNTDCCARQGLSLSLVTGLSGTRLRVTDSQTEWPAALLAGLGTPWNTVQAEGQLALSTRSLSLEWAAGRWLLSGRAQLDALQMSSRLSTLRPMGSYRITLQGGSTSTLQLQTLEGALQLSGDGRWVGSRLHFNGVATASPEREAALSNLLNIIGRRNGPRSIITVG